MNKLIIYLLLVLAVPTIADCPRMSIDPYIENGPVKIHSVVDENEFNGKYYCEKNSFDSAVIYIKDGSQIEGPHVGLVTEIEKQGIALYAVYWAAASSFYQTIIEVSNGTLVKVSEKQVPERP